MNTQLDKPIELGSLYSLNEIIGLGATGVVYRGVNKESGTPIAAKILHPHHIKDPDILNQFLQEKTLLTSLDHSAIVTVKDLVAEASTLAIITELVDGYSLRECLKTQTNLTPHSATLIATRVLAALEHAHEAGITHRDIKPDNILLTHTWENGDANGVKLADFGISTIIARPTDTTAPSGTPAYMPPELWAQHIYNQPGDVYETGVTLYEMLAGHPPFPVSDAAHHHENSTPPQLDIPTPLWHALATMLAKNPEQRPTATQARTQLESILPSLEGLPVLPPAEQPENYTPVTVVKTPTKNLTGDTANTQGKPASGIPAFNFAQFDNGGPETKLHAAPHRTNDSNLNTQEEEPEKKKKKALLILAASLAAIALLGGATFLGFHLSNSNSADASSAKGKEGTSSTQENNVPSNGEVDPAVIGGDEGIVSTDDDTSLLGIDFLDSYLSGTGGGDSSHVTGLGEHSPVAVNDSRGFNDSTGSQESGVSNRSILVRSVTVTGSTSLVAGNQTTLKATVAPSNATNKGVTWKSSNSAVAQVNSQGQVSAIKEGKVTITATAKDGSKKSGSLTINVTRKITPINVYRLYNKKSGEHIFTTNSNEKNSLSSQGWTYENVAWQAPDYSSVPVYRLYNKASGEHLLTSGANEKNTLSSRGWTYEGVAFYSADNGNRVPIYRLYNKTSGLHLWTKNTNEVSSLGKSGWVNEGVAFYAMG